MTPPLESLTPPQTAAELLVGLLRSQLFAESLFGQVFEQSRPYLDRPAGDYAAALVQKRVLTRWQATELLAGRVGLYAGTFRLLERLFRTDEAQLFAAEQSGPQRLVLLQISRSVTAEDSASIENIPVASPQHAGPRQPHVAHCIVAQQTSQLRLLAYEFMEVKPLWEFLAATPIERPHAAHLVRQLATTLAVLRDEIISSLDLSVMWIDSQGQLKLLVGPNPFASDTAQSQLSPQREALQLAAVHRFTTALGGLPEVANCRLMSEVVLRLSKMEKPWAASIDTSSRHCSRASMNRHLRRGPALRLIEALGEELQFVLDDPGEKSASQPRVEENLAPTEIEAASSPAPPAARGRSRRRAWAASTIVVLVVAAVLATLWAGHWRARPAAAATEEPKTSPTPNH